MSEITNNPSVPTQVIAELKFPNFIANLGIIPTSYKDSMSYYECLAWLCKYLEDTVIPTVNQNGKAVEELQALYIELNNYVTNYFENLDVQEEINNKLDAMVQDGTLAEIINQEIFGELSNSKTSWINVVSVGHLDNSGESENDSKLATLLSSVGENDTVYFPKGTYLFSQFSIASKTNVKFIFDGIIKSNNGAIINGLVRCQFYNLKIIRDYTKYDYTTMLNTGLEHKNSKYCVFYNLYIEGFNKGLFFHGDGSSNSYNQFYNLHIFDTLHSWSVQNENGGFSNEICVFGGRFSCNLGEQDPSGIVEYINIPYGCSMHNFYSVCLEGALTRINCAGQYNNFIGCRMEGVNSNGYDIIISGNNNKIIESYWDESETPTFNITGNYNIIEERRRYNIDKTIPEIVKTITSDYTLLNTDSLLLCDCTNGNITINLPPTRPAFEECFIKIIKIDKTTNTVSLFTQGQTDYQIVGRSNVLQNFNDEITLYLQDSKWYAFAPTNIYKSSLTTNIQYNGMEFKDGIYRKIISQGGTVSTVQITNTYANTTQDSPNITLTIGASNRTLKIGDYITIDGESGYFIIEALNLTEFTASLNRNVTQTLTNARIRYQYPVEKYLGLIYDKVDNKPTTAGTIGDLVFYNTPVAEGYIGAVYTASGWKNFGQIEE